MSSESGEVVAVSAQSQGKGGSHAKGGASKGHIVRSASADPPKEMRNVVVSPDDESDSVLLPANRPRSN
jgi:hypothetical protein